MIFMATMISYSILISFLVAFAAYALCAMLSTFKGEYAYWKRFANRVFNKYFGGLRYAKGSK